MNEGFDRNNDDENTYVGSTLVQKTDSNRLCLSERKKFKRSEVAVMGNRSRSCLSEMTNIVANGLKTCQLQVKTDYPTDFHANHKLLMSPSPVAAGAENAGRTKSKTKALFPSMSINNGIPNAFLILQGR